MNLINLSIFTNTITVQNKRQRTSKKSAALFIVKFTSQNTDHFKRESHRYIPTFSKSLIISSQTPSREWKLLKIIPQWVWVYAYLSYNYSTLPLLLESSVKCQCFLKLGCAIYASSAQLHQLKLSRNIDPVNFVVQSFIWAVQQNWHFYYIITYVRPHILVWKLLLMLGFNDYIKTKLLLVVQI